MRVVFLDFDGVLNFGSGNFRPELVARLNRVLRETGARIVVHSTWRYKYDTLELWAILRKAGVEGRVLDACESPFVYSEVKGLAVACDNWLAFKGNYATNDERAIAIQRWLDTHPEVERFIIFDDEGSLGHFVGTPNFIRTDMRVGLSEANSDRAIEVLLG